MNFLIHFWFSFNLFEKVAPTIVWTRTHLDWLCSFSFLKCVSSGKSGSDELQPILRLLCLISVKNISWRKKAWFWYSTFKNFNHLWRFQDTYLGHETWLVLNWKTSTLPEVRNWTNMRKHRAQNKDIFEKEKQLVSNQIWCYYMLNFSIKVTRLKITVLKLTNKTDTNKIIMKKSERKIVKLIGFRRSSFKVLSLTRMWQMWRFARINRIFPRAF